MRIAVPYENGQIFQHFGQSERFKVYDVEEHRVVTATTINTNGSKHGALPDVLKKIQVNELICGGIGGGAKKALAEAGIKLMGGVTGEADQAVQAYLNGTLVFDPQVECKDHGHEHGGSGSVCDCGHSEK